MAKKRLIKDFLVIAASICLAWVIVHFGAVDALLVYIGDGVLFVAFVAGIFFTSILTTAPAIAVLGSLASHTHPVLIAVLGGAGAVLGDYFIFIFMRDRLVDDISYLLRHTDTPRLFKIFHRKSFRWVLPFVGGLIIASPLPDELGLTLLGISKMSTSRFLIFSYTFNTIGILLVGLAARSLAW